MNLVTTLSALSPAEAFALLATVALKGALIFLLALLITGLMRRASAAARHAVWTLALAAALLLPVLYLTLPGWEVPVLPDDASETFSAVPAAPVAPPAPRAPLAPPLQGMPAPPVAPQPEVHIHLDEGSEHIVIERHVLQPQPEAATPGTLSRAQYAVSSLVPNALRYGATWVLLVWVLGAGFLMMRWLFAVIGAWRLVREATPVEDRDWQELKDRLVYSMDIDREVRLLRSDRLGVPVAGGTFDPVVVLPADADTWSEERREVVMTHELAHIARGDCLTQTVAQWALAVHWFNPLAHVAHRMYLLEREHACDDYVLNYGAMPSDYAEHLLQIARRFRRETLALHATAPMARKSNLETRITTILNPERCRTVLDRAALGMASLVALALVLPLAAFHPIERASDLESVDYAAFALSPAKVVAERLPMTVYQFSGDTKFEWEGRVQRGGFVEVKGINGPIRARTGSGDRVRVEAHKTSKRGQEASVEIVVNEFANGIAVCAVYPGQTGECAPGDGMQGNVRDNDVTVAFELTLPENVRFSGHTVNGDIKTDKLGSDVEVHTVNGSIRTASQGDVEAGTVNGSIEAEAAGLVRAQTVNGSIDARLGRADWSGEMVFRTVNGSITLDFPASLNTTVEARAQTGSIHSDFPLQIRRNGYVGAEADGTIGNGGRHLELDVLNGSIRLQRTSGTFGAHINRDRAYDRQEIRNAERRREVRLRAAQARVAEQVRRDTLRVARQVEREARQALRQAEQMLQNLSPQLAWALDEDEIADLEDDLSEALDDLRAELAGLGVNAEWDVVVDWEEIEEAFEDVEWEIEAAMHDVERELERAERELEVEEECEDEHEHER